MKKIYSIIFLISASMLGLQIAIIYLLSIVQWYHFAYMIISAALLGFGASGTFLSLLKNKILKIENIIFYLLLLCSISSVLSVYALSLPELSYDSYLLFTDYFQMSKLFLNYIIFFIPFFFGALVIAVIFVKYPEKINKIYFINLLGSAAGAVIPIIAINIIPAENIIPVISLFPFIASLICFPRTAKIRNTIFVSINFILIIYILYTPLKLNLSEYKGLSYALNLHNTILKSTSQSIYGQMKYVRTPMIRYAPGISLNYTGQLPSVDMIYLNSESLGPVFHKKNDLSIFNKTSMVLPYKLKHRKNVLVLDAKTFTGGYYALFRGAENITVVDLTANETQKVIKRYSDYSDFKNMKILAVNSKTYILTAENKYDLIKIPAIDSFGGVAGLFALQENYLITVESIKKILGLLQMDGILYIPVWTDHPPRNFLKILSTLVEALEDLNLNPSEHITAVRDWGMLHFMIKKNQFTAAEIDLIKNFCSENMFDIAIADGLRNEERMKYNIIEETFFEYIDEIMFGNRKQFYNNYKFNINPPDDDRPFFFNFIKWRTIPEIIKTAGIRNFAFNELGYLILFFSFIQICIAAVILIIIPLLKLKKKLNYKSYSIIYFSALGLGYMFFEITLIQKFTLYFGSPVYSAALIISFMLAVSGLGSYASAQIIPTKKNICKICCIVSVCMMLYYLFNNIIFYRTINYPFFLKVLISFIIISPLAFVMGMPFPTGLKFISKKDEEGIPWCWGINGCFSVIASVLAVIVSVEFGFSTAGLFSLVCYLSAGIININFEL